MRPWHAAEFSISNLVHSLLPCVKNKESGFLPNKTSSEFHQQSQQGREITLDWLMSHATPIPHCGCWSWDLFRNAKGYGRVHVERGKSRFAHRLAFALSCGPIPDGMHIDHVCRVPSCINPEHLEVVTPEENHRRGKHGALKVAPSACSKGHKFCEANPRRPRGRACTICYQEATKRNNDIGNARRRANAIASDPLYGSEERRLRRVRDALHRRWHG